jgi:CBS domain-containing protein
MQAAGSGKVAAFRSRTGGVNESPRREYDDRRCLQGREVRMPHRLVRSVVAKQKPFSAPGKTTVAEAARMMKKHNVGAVMVVDGGRLTGIFTERDALFRVLAESRNPATTRLADVMTAKPQTIDPNKVVGHALLLMYEGGFRHVPVVDRGKPIGMISARDALGPELQEFQTELLHRDHIREIIG